MTERDITVENVYMQQNYLIRLCMGYTDRLAELEAKYHKLKAENWQHRAKQLKSANHELRLKCDAFKEGKRFYRERFLEERADNRALREKLAKYEELERVLGL